MSHNRRQKNDGGKRMEQFTFYEWYADILQSMDDISAGKLANCICAYEFEDREPMEQLSDKEDFYWSNIASILKEVKETESIGKIPKKYNLQSKHFTFYETYYKAMKLMNTRKQGIFVKAICGYMFQGTEPQFKDVCLQGYFNLCKRKLDVSKKRKSSGQRGGAQKKKICAASLTEETVSEVQRTEMVVSSKIQTYEDFRNAYPDIEGSLFGSAERYKTDLDWGDVAAKYDADEELKNVRNIFQLVRRYEQKYSEKW